MSSQRRGHPEADLQRSVVETLRLVLRPPFVVSATINEVRMGGREGRIAQGIAIGMGIHPGFPDVTVLQDGRVLFMELKTPDGVLSKEQKEFRNFALDEGHGWTLVRSLDEALEAVKLFHLKTRIRNG